jgi:hypothetical protein
MKAPKPTSTILLEKPVISGNQPFEMLGKPDTRIYSYTFQYFKMLFFDMFEVY